MFLTFFFQFNKKSFAPLPPIAHRCFSNCSLMSSTHNPGYHVITSAIALCITIFRSKTHDLEAGMVAETVKWIRERIIEPEPSLMGETPTKHSKNTLTFFEQPWARSVGYLRFSLLVAGSLHLRSCAKTSLLFSRFFVLLSTDPPSSDATSLDPTRPCIAMCAPVCEHWNFNRHVEVRFHVVSFSNRGLQLELHDAVAKYLATQCSRRHRAQWATSVRRTTSCGG